MSLRLSFLLVLLSFCDFARGDGFHVPSRHDRHLRWQEPSQKALIAWDGHKETMVLTSAVKADEIADFAWVIPIASRSKPIVSAVDGRVFEVLRQYFRKKLEFGALTGEVQRSEAARGVTVVEVKEVDVYDITTLKATDSGELVGWLNANGYLVPENGKPIFDKYVSRGDAYFIANRIDLKNKYAAQIAEVQRIHAQRSADPLGGAQLRLALPPEASKGEARQTALAAQVSAVYERLGSRKNRASIKPLYDATKALARGMGTPLKIEFEPREPVYPLEISNLSKGNTIIEVYFLGKTPYMDRNNALRIDESVAIDASLRRKLVSHIDLAGAEIVTRLTYEGPLNLLQADAVFQSRPFIGPIPDRDELSAANGRQPVVRTPPPSEAEETKQQMAASSATPPARLAELARDEDRQVRMAVAENPHTPQQALKLLASDPFEWVRQRVSRNPSTPEETLIRLASDPFNEVRAQITGRYDAPPEALRVLAGDKDAHIRARAAHNANTPPEALHILAKDADPAVVRAAQSALAKRAAVPER